MSKKPKRFKKKVEWDDSINPKTIPFVFSVIFVFIFLSISLATLLENHQTVMGELETAKASIYSGLLSLFFLIIACIPKRKVYWEEVKNDK